MRSEARHGPVALEGSEVRLVGPAELSVTLSSCNGKPEVASLDERNGTVELVTTQVARGPADNCLDVVHVALDAADVPVLETSDDGPIGHATMRTIAVN